jgi:hypothetical protein
MISWTGDGGDAGCGVRRLRKDSDLALMQAREFSSAAVVQGFEEGDQAGALPGS